MTSRIALISRILLLAISAAAAGCASTQSVAYRVTSTPPGAQIDVNGVQMGNTPTDIRLTCSKKWVGVMNAPGGYANSSGTYKVEAFPTQKGGVSQTKRVDPCEWAGTGTPTLNFDLGLELVAPTQNINMNINSGDSEKEKTARTLRSLRDQGILTEDEYKKKMSKLYE